MKFEFGDTVQNLHGIKPHRRTKTEKRGEIEKIESNQVVLLSENSLLNIGIKKLLQAEQRRYRTVEFHNSPVIPRPFLANATPTVYPWPHTNRYLLLHLRGWSE